MSWNLVIFSESSDHKKLPLGEKNAVKLAITEAFPGLIWESSMECVLPGENGFRIEFSVEETNVLDGFTHGGFDHLLDFVDLCLKQGWRLADAQEGEEIDLGNPLAFYQ